MATIQYKKGSLFHRLLGNHHSFYIKKTAYVREKIDQLRKDCSNVVQSFVVIKTVLIISIYLHTCFFINLFYPVLLEDLIILL